MIIDDYIFILLPLICLCVIIWGWGKLSKFSFGLNVLLFIVYVTCFSYSYYSSLEYGGGSDILWWAYMILVSCLHILLLLTTYVKYFNKHRENNEASRYIAYVMILLFLCIVFLFIANFMR